MGRGRRLAEAGRRWAVLGSCGALVPLLGVGPAWGAGAASAASPDPPFAVDAPAVPPAEVVPGEVLVRFDAATSPAERTAIVASLGARVTEHLDRSVPDLALVSLPPGADTQQVASVLAGRPGVRYAEPNFVASVAATPNDTRFGELWGLHNTGQNVNGTAGTVDADIDALEAWAHTTGSAGVVVAVLDTGIAYDHPDLAPNAWVNGGEVAGNGVDDDGNGYVDDRRGWDAVDPDSDPIDENGHGTHVAGTIGARGDNDTSGGDPTDVVGVSWEVSLLPVRVLDRDGFGSYAEIIEGIGYVAANGAHIANMSLTGRLFSSALRDAIAAAPDVLFVVAAGNDGVNVDSSPRYPCSYDLPHIVCVAATDQHDQLASFSNHGSSSVDLAAPGTNVLSTWPYRTLFFDDFETDIAPRWTTGGSPDTWERTTEASVGGDGHSLTDSPFDRYENNTDNHARISSSFDFSGSRDCNVEYAALTDLAFNDFLHVEAATSTSGPWQTIRTHGGNKNGWFRDRLTDLEGRAGVHVRFRLTSNAVGPDDGAYVDEVRIECSGIYTAGSFAYLAGTSMATPHVAGVAALVRARFPVFTVDQLRDRILATVDPKSALAGKVATGGRVNALGAVTNLPPIADAGDDVTVDSGAELDLDGTGSSDPEGMPLAYLWVQVSGPAATIRDEDDAVAHVTAPQGPATLEFQLTVTDAHGATSSDTVVVTVRSPK